MPFPSLHKVNRHLLHRVENTYGSGMDLEFSFDIFHFKNGECDFRKPKDTWGS